MAEQLNFGDDPDLMRDCPVLRYQTRTSHTFYGTPYSVELRFPFPQELR